MSFWDAAFALPTGALLALFIALIVAFAFEFVNGFHDTANAVTTVIYTRSLPATPAVIYSGFLNFLGVLLGGTAVAFGIVNLLPVDLLVEAGHSNAALVMVLSLLLAGLIWNLGTWYFGLPVSSSHALIGSILGVGLANGLWNGQLLDGVNTKELTKVGLALLFSPFLGFVGSALLLLTMKLVIRSPRLYVPPEGDDRPPGWVRGVLIATCGGVSFAHGANDGQKGMGLMLLVLVGFLPMHYALNQSDEKLPDEVLVAMDDIRSVLQRDGKLTPEADRAGAKARQSLVEYHRFEQIPPEERWAVRRNLYTFNKEVNKAQLSAEEKESIAQSRQAISRSIEFVPLWVVIGVALALGVGTTIGYKRIVVTVAEKIGKTHLTYAQGAAAETVAAITILLAALTGLPVSTTQVLSSGVAGTMVANKSGLRGDTARRILMAWMFTLPSTILMSGVLFLLGRVIVG